MKTLLPTLLLLLTGCGHSLTLEQLEEQALLTGDWAAVEKREQAIERRQSRLSNVCAKGTVLVCESQVTTRNCDCVRREELERYVFGSLR